MVSLDRMLAGISYLHEDPAQPPRRLTRDDATNYNAVFSPDGRWIVFTSERTGNADLFALDLERAGEPVRLTRHAAMDDAAAFSPDGKWVVFTSDRAGFNDEWPLGWFPQPYGELFAIPAARRCA